MIDKIIGTSIPLFSLKSRNSQAKPNGTIEDGILFLNWLNKTKQKAWQLLPIHETNLSSDGLSHAPSPYKSYGYGIDPRYSTKNLFEINPQELEEFNVKNKYWIEDYTLFCAIRDYFKNDDWRKWDKSISTPSIKSKKVWSEKLKEQIKIYLNQQYLLHREYKKMKEFAQEKGILLLGDMQFYLPLRSPVVWANQHLFRLTSEKNMEFVSGIPNKKGIMYGRQIWNHPLYNWDDTNLEDIISLFVLRQRYLSELFDMIRIDHASGFFRYGVISIKNESEDEISTGPGSIALTNLVNEAKKIGVKIFAEDAGYDLGSLRETMHSLNIPGVRVLRCAYDETHDLFINDHANLENYSANCVVYSSTHDTETLLSYMQGLNTDQKLKLSMRLKIEYSRDNYKMAINLRNAAIDSKARYVIIPLQDWFSTTERINIPGTEKPNNDPNWTYRMADNIENLPSININT